LIALAGAVLLAVPPALAAPQIGTAAFARVWDRQDRALAEQVLPYVRYLATIPTAQVLMFGSSPRIIARTRPASVEKTCILVEVPFLCATRVGVG
jgi:hypothetical protein